MSFIDDFQNENKAGSHELEKQGKPKRILKPRFSVNLSDDDYERVKDYCNDMGISCAGLARMLILKEISKK